MKKINLKQLLIALGYGETTWKATRTRMLKKLGIENPQEMVMVEESLAREVIELVAEVKTKTKTANVILGEKKYLDFTMPYTEEVKPKKTATKTSGNTTVKGKSTRELESALDTKNIVIRDLKKENENVKRFKELNEKLTAENQELKSKIHDLEIKFKELERLNKENEKLILEQQMEMFK